MTDSQALDVQAVAAALQAFAAVVVAVLTWQLIVATRAYVATTREQVAASQEQLAELREARASASRPRIYPLGVGRSAGPSAGLQMVQLRVINLGGGPAIDLTPVDDGIFTCDPPRAHLPEHENLLFTFTPRGSAIDLHHTFVLVHGDIDGGHARTSIEVDLNAEVAGGSIISVSTVRL